MKQLLFILLVCIACFTATSCIELAGSNVHSMMPRREAVRQLLQNPTSDLKAGHCGRGCGGGCGRGCGGGCGRGCGGGCGGW
ncbi:unnamed protein product [Rotaria sp. Silwood1]|nr:unnamed protein product [Rotaria sp. Silwood1]CAF4632719.1 unnamed protein product [Rotaria sp. Silwood1]CAF4930596.1 unnamed protein product [Rotaria sp. Silwood1]